MSNEQIEGNVILVIDDDEINLQMAKMILEKKLPCRVITSDNGLQGIEIMHRQFVKLVLLDVVMPFMNGIQTLEKIREDPKLKSMPVIMLTASTDKTTIAQAIKLGVTDYVKKPFMPDQLVERVSKKLGPITNKSTFTVLLIDDDSSDLESGKKALEDNLPYNVVTATSGIEGMETLRKSKIDLVLASTEMSFINGFRIADFIHGDSGLRNIPTFLLTHATAATDPDMLQRIESSYAQGYLNKPLNSTNLAPLIKFLKSRK